MLRDSKLTSLPNNLKVGGHLFASYLKLTKIPDDIEVGINLYLHGAGFDEEDLPKSLKVAGKIYASSLKPI